MTTHVARTLALVIALLLGYSPTANAPRPPDPTGRVALNMSASFAAPAQATTTDFVAAYGGLTRALKATENALYMAQGFRIEVADLAPNPAKPRFVATLAFTQTVAALAVAEGRLFAAVGERLVVFDIADPLGPAPIAEIALSGWASRLEVAPSGTLVYAAFTAPRSEGIDLIDIASPAAPRVVGRIDVDSRVEDMAAGDGVLYVAAIGLRVFDTRDPATPTVVPFDWGGASCCVRRVARIGALLYTVHDDRRRGITMVSASALVDPLRPDYRGGTGTNAYEVRAFFSHDGWLLKAGLSLDRLTTGLHVLGGSRGTYDLGWEGRATLYGQVTAVAAHGALVYAASEGCGLTVLRLQAADFEASDVAELPVAGALPIAGSVAGVAVHGSRAVVMGAPRESCNRIDALDLSDLAAPRQLSVTPLPGRPAAMARSADGVAVSLRAASTDALELRMWHEAPGGGTLSAPVAGVVDAYHLAPDARTGNVVAAGGRGGGDGAYVWTVMPDGIATKLVPPTDVVDVAAMAADGGRLALFGADAQSGDGVMRLFDLAGMRRLGEAPHELVGDQGYGAAMSEKAVYLAGAGLSVFDIANPEAPGWVQALVVGPDYGPASIARAGDQFAIASNGLWLCESSNAYDPCNPVRPWTLDVRAEDVAIMGVHVLVAAGDAGLLVLRMLPTGWRAEHAVYLPATATGH